VLVRYNSAIFAFQQCSIGLQGAKQMHSFIINNSQPISSVFSIVWMVFSGLD